ncbi:MAG: aromatic ring-hydroxylating dioxygenase subunit alpha [Steroidobacteraceae bacterium]
MNAVSPDGTVSDWNGLRRVEPTLPSRFYTDAAHFQLELEKIWYRNWTYLCRADALEAPRAFRTFRLGTQSLLVLRDDAGALRAFHNTCAHRGATLCSEASGHLPGGAITCRYHAFSYGLDGRFLRRPAHARPESEGIRNLKLHAVQIKEWQGFIFINLLTQAAPDPETFFQADAAMLKNWPLARLRVAHAQERTVRSNWKILWENYNECLHCPGVHPSLGRLVPIYRRGIMEPKDDPNWQAHADSPEPEFQGGLRSGAATWSTDGKLHGIPFPQLTARERELGYHYLSFPPSLYLVAHTDYVRVVRYLPLGPDLTQVNAEWLVAPESMAEDGFDIQPCVDFVNEVMGEDAGVCELTQQGLQSIAHVNGVLAPEEYDVFKFQSWIRDELAR